MCFLAFLLRFITFVFLFATLRFARRARVCLLLRPVYVAWLLTNTISTVLFIISIHVYALFHVFALFWVHVCARADVLFSKSLHVPCPNRAVFRCQAVARDSSHRACHPFRVLLSAGRCLSASSPETCVVPLD